jgi:hypothetical protein
MRVVIDPGHGGTHDNGKSTALGARGPRGTLEKDVTIRLARQVARHLGGAAGLTRDERGNPTLAARAAVASRERAHVFVSLHANQGQPGALGSEIWLHERSAASSAALSSSIRSEMARLGGGQPSLRRGNLAVLTPDRLAGHTAACLVELDYLSHPEGERRLGNPATLDRWARAIARGIDGYLRTAVPAYGRRASSRALDMDEFDDSKDLTQTVTNPKASDTRQVSTPADAHAVVATFRGSSATSPWTSLSRATVADRLDELIDAPGLVRQGLLNLCGPASFVRVWAKRDPVAFAQFATTLFDNGRASIGDFQVAPTDALVKNDYAAMRAKMGSDATATPQADWMVLGALRNNDDAVFVWSGEPGSSLHAELAGMTFPEEIVKWLRATGIYASIDNRVGSSPGALVSKGFNAAVDLDNEVTRDGTDIIVLIQGNMVSDRVTGIGIASDPTFLSHFSNHWVVLIGQVQENVVDHTVQFPIWSFGRDFNTTVKDVDTFARNYYGAIVARLA